MPLNKETKPTKPNQTERLSWLALKPPDLSYNKTINQNYSQEYQRIFHCRISMIEYKT